MKKLVPLTFVLLLSFGTVGCATSGQGSRAQQAALFGSLAGAGLGAIIGHQSGETGEGAAIGAAAGALGGYVFGNEQDKVDQQHQTAEAIAQANSVVINVTNSNGSITPVKLVRQGPIYVGPKGERYTVLPTEDQLRPIYGF